MSFLIIVLHNQFGIDSLFFYILSVQWTKK